MLIAKQLYTHFGPMSSDGPSKAVTGEAVVNVFKFWIRGYAQMAQCSVAMGRRSLRFSPPALPILIMVEIKQLSLNSYRYESCTPTSPTAPP